MLFFFLAHFSFQSLSIKANESSTEPYLYDFSKPGSYSFSLPPGRYKVFCYGGQGGNSYSGGRVNAAIGGLGAFVSGYFNVSNNNRTFYAFVGGMGLSHCHGSSPGGFNGGGNSGYCEKYKGHRWGHKKQRENGPGSGGGATDLRADKNDVNSRVIVAAGGSGACDVVAGAPGGNLIGYNAKGPSGSTTQNKGNGIGQGAHGVRNTYLPASGGGGGYYGGIGGFGSHNNPIIGVSDSGSSYISGYNGCLEHTLLTLDSGQMTVGHRKGNGALLIQEIYKCSDNCLECVGAEQCLKCQSPYYLFNGLCYSKCPVGSIQKDAYCDKCHPTCSACSMSTTNCTKCSDDLLFYKNKCIPQCPAGTFLFGRTCQDKCPTGHYGKDGECKECSLECKDCENTANKCIDCPAGKYLFNSECIDNCPDRSVRDGNKCLTECPSNQFLYNHICYKECPKGTYQKGIICEDCHSSCNECKVKPDQCISCRDGTYLFDSQCKGECPTGFFGYQHTCVPSCPASTFSEGKLCLDKCPKGKYGINNKCRNCDSSCAACKNSSTFCTACNKNTFLVNNRCELACPNRTFLFRNKCVLECPRGYLPHNNECQDENEYFDMSAEIVKKSVMSTTAISLTIVALTVIIIVEGFLIMYAVKKKFSFRQKS